MPDYTDVPISSFPDAQSVDASDKVTGLKSGANTNFSFNSILAWLISQFYAVFLPASSKGAAGGVASLDSTGKVPGTQLDLSGKQDKIAASGILKGDGAGDVSAAVAGTDYQAPLTAGTDYATPAMIPTVPSAYTSNPAMDGTASPGSSGAWAKGDHVHPSDTTKANQAQLAYVETGTTASRNYVVGEYFCWNGLLYRVKTAISSGGTITPGTNCEQVTGGGLNDTTVIDLSSSVSINTTNLYGIKCSLKVRKKLVQFTATLTTNSLTSLYNKELAYLPPLGVPADNIHVNAIWVQNYTSGTTQTKSILLLIDPQGRLRSPNQGGYDGTASTTNSRIYFSVLYITA